MDQIKIATIISNYENSNNGFVSFSKEKLNRSGYFPGNIKVKINGKLSNVLLLNLDLKINELNYDLQDSILSFLVNRSKEMDLRLTHINDIEITPKENLEDTCVE